MIRTLTLLLLLVSPPARADVGDEHLAAGTPAPAGKSDDALLLRRPQYVVSYNRGTANPNWVAWRLTRADLGGADRQNSFRPDPDLPAGWYRARPSAYAGSGFDRGHLCPSGDRTASPEDNGATYLLTNVVPQSPMSNERAWNQLETYCRGLAAEGKTLYVAAGPLGHGGTGSKGPADTLDEGRLTVPARLWKIVLILPGGVRPEKATEVRALAVLMPNDQTVGEAWHPYLRTVAEVERLSGCRFGRALPAAVRATIK